jgi:hypothetical protein
MMITARHVLWTAAIAVSMMAAYKGWSHGVIVHPPGVLVPETPHQNLLPPGKVWQKDDFFFTALAEYRIRGRILSTEPYWFGRESELSPVDFAMGWGPMSDQSVLDDIKISQGRRWYYWKAKVLPLPRELLVASSANVHIIPANDEIADQLDLVQAGSIVQLQGYLVAVQTGEGWRWRSSLSRTDTGNGACEILWVEQIVIE